jgi:hypothetical protein
LVLTVFIVCGELHVSADDDPVTIIEVLVCIVDLLMLIGSVLLPVVVLVL